MWLILAGRFWGKTRSGAEETINRALAHPGFLGAVVAPTFRSGLTDSIESRSGLLGVTPPDEIANWNRSTGELWLRNGSKIQLYSADEPQRLRGPSLDFAWCDELAAWRYLSRREDNPWDMLQMAVRIGRAQIIATTTPKPRRKLIEIIESDQTVVTRGSSRENLGNVSERMYRDVIARYEGTALGRQELEAELIEQAQGALWKRDEIERHRVAAAPELDRIVVAIDPSTTAHESSDEAGIIVAGRGPAPKGADLPDEPHAYVIEDCSGIMTAATWASEAVRAYHRHSADRLIAEVNQGGDMVEEMVRRLDKTLAYRPVHAKYGKRLRAEPVSAAYERGLVHHVGSDLELLEDQMCLWEPDQDRKSPDRVDALVYAITDLLLGRQACWHPVAAPEKIIPHEAVMFDLT